MWFFQIVRSFFFTLDSTLFNFIPKVYDLLMTISRTSILTQGQIKQFADRIQIFLGVFMLFRVTFSLITYIIMPDEFSDKGKGFGKLWQNIIISLVLLVLTPYAFNLAYEFQAMVLEDNSLATLVFGDSGDTENYLSTAGEKMAYTIMEPMFSPNTSVGNLFSCSNMIEEGNGVRTFDTDCKQALLDASSTGNSVSAYNSYVNNYVAGAENSNLGLFFRIDIAKQTIPGNKNNGDETFLIDYNAPVSTIVAVVVLLLLITFCMDVALRSIKLAFLQLISPIPIISYIDPKGKDGMFKKWYQMCFSTYLSLFVRLLALYLGVYIIGKVNSMTDVITGASVTNGFVKIFIIIGVLMFAKQLPKILEGIGIKLDGEGKFQLNPFKKLGEEAMFMKKPMENFEKDGYGIGLGAKKIISGIDSARAGKGFWNGTRKVQGNGMVSQTSKWYHDLTPNRTEQINKSREAVATLNYKKRLYEEGQRIGNMDSRQAPGVTVKQNVSDKKKAMSRPFVDADGNAALSVDKTARENAFNDLGKALVEQYGGDTAKNREYARITVEKTQAELEMRRLTALQRQAYDPNTGKFDKTRINGAQDLNGGALETVEALESAIETQRKIIESVGEYSSREKEFQYKNGIVDDALSTAKGLEPRRNDIFS